MNKMMIILISCLSATLFGTDPPTEDRKAILAMAGTYAVGFHFQETVSFQNGYEPKPAYDAAALEWVTLVEDSGHKIVLQHVLQTKRGIVKHWRQDWLYENNVLWEYEGAHTWRKRTLPPEQVAGTWTQRVFQVDDSPRYESLGNWQHLGNLSQWESAATNRPVPRRDATKRDDYNILAARNRHALTLTGWVHEQDNVKLRREDEDLHYIVREVGVNRYDRILTEKCDGAIQWWQTNSRYWQTVRTVWAEVLADKEVLRLRPVLDDKPLYKHLFDAGEALAQADENKIRQRVTQIISRFMLPPHNQSAKAAIR